MRSTYIIITLLILSGLAGLYAQESKAIKNPSEAIVTDRINEDAFALVHNKTTADLYYEEADFELVRMAVKNLQADIAKVSDVKPAIINELNLAKRRNVIIGTIDKCYKIKELSDNDKIDIEDIRGQWETFKIIVVDKPFPNIDKALVLVGSDRRGTAYAVYELCKQIGVSPWYFWADVPVNKKADIFVKRGSYQFGPPSVKYRGIFINDYKYGLRKWAGQTQDPQTGGLGENSFRKVFELMLRLKANYIWNGTRPEIAKIANDYAIVLGTPHNRQMLASGWNKDKQGPWQYDINRDNIYNFWNSWVEKLGGFEAVYTIGMRSNLDLPMQGDLTIDEKVALMEEIIDDQRQILTNNIDQPIEDIPQVLVLYKEVLGLYNQGIKVPDDVTLVWPDDNYGYMKRFSNSKERARMGGAGVYYHLSYLGRPHDYLWLSTTHPVLIWEEMQKAYDFNARELWVFNVGDIKPAEYNISFALDMAWDVSAFNKDNLRAHKKKWLEDIFGPELAKELEDIRYTYYQLAFERKPEYMGWDRLEPTTPVVDSEFSSIHYREAERRLRLSKDIKERTDVIYQSLPQNQKAAFFQLVWYPVACQYYTDAKLLHAQTNRLFARQGRASTNHYAELAAVYWDSIKIATKNYHNLLDGKWQDIIQWDGIGINPPKYWLPKSETNANPIENQPNYFMPPVEKNSPAKEASMGIFLEGFENKVQIDGRPRLPWFNSIYQRSYYFEIFNKGLKPFEYKISTSDDWITISSTKGNCVDDSRIVVTIDYKNRMEDEQKELHQGFITVAGAGSTHKIDVFVFTPLHIQTNDLSGLFVEDNGCISIYAENFHRKKDMSSFGWEITNDLGVTGSSIGAYPFSGWPVEQEWELEHDKQGAYVEYDFYCFNTGWVDIYSYSLPTFPINSQRHCLYGISIDDGPPLIVDFATKIRSEKWKQNVQRNQSENITKHFIKNSGKHTLKIWMIDTGVFIDKIMIDFGGLKKSYLGPQQTRVH